MFEIKLNTINLDDYIKQRNLPVQGGALFKLLFIKCSFWGQQSVTFDFEDSLDIAKSKGGYFSLIIGKNGLCKSSLLRELIDFFIDAQSLYSRRKNSHVIIHSVKYKIDNSTYQIDNQGNNYYYQKDGEKTDKKYMKYPLIIASTMGMFDKFPVNNQDNNTKGRYDIRYYHYVGPKASSNMFSSKTNVLLQLLSALPSIKNEDQLDQLGVLLNFIGYDPSMVLRFELKESLIGRQSNKEPMSREEKTLYLSLANGKNNFDFAFRHDEYEGIKKLPLKSLNNLRQKGALKKCKCYFYKCGKEVDVNYLSSGEFNLLCIVMSVILAADSRHLLILLDEPEISQHPNWQLDLIPNLEKALVDYGCHFLIATHCHFLVSNLPLGRSNVISIAKDKNGVFVTEKIPSETYGWSAEEVLLKVFSVPTDRNRYLAKMVADFLTHIGEKSVGESDVTKNLAFFKDVTCHLSEVDPMKLILDTIINEFER